MLSQDLRIRYGELRRANDLDGVARLLAEYPELVALPECAAELMHSAAQDGNTTIVALLADRGVDINIVEGPGAAKRPIDTAAGQDRTNTVRWLIEHGASINHVWGNSQSFCHALIGAINYGNFELVHALTEAGAYLNVLDRSNKTPLSWAIAFGRKDIEEYLRSKGALEAHQIPGYAPPPPEDPIPDYVARTYGRVEELGWVRIVPDEIPIVIRVGVDQEISCVFTEGMSARTMVVPPGGEQYQYAELVTYLHAWPADRSRWLEPEYAWPINWMRRLAQYPFEHGTWLGGQTAVVANGDPPEPLGPNTAMTCWLLLADKEPVDRVEMPDGREVVFYEMVPIHTAERDFEREHGTEALLEKFAEHGVPEYLDPARPSVV